MTNAEDLEKYADYLSERELAVQTRQIYLKQAENFLDFLDGRAVTRKEAIDYKQSLLEQNNKIATNNLYIVALNSYLKYKGHDDFCIKTRKIQRRQCPDNIISLNEYKEMLMCAKESGRDKYYCIMRTLALTGIRVSELSGCTVEALETGKFIICNKGKSREIYLPEKLVTELSAYCMQEGIIKGVIFLGNTGKAISRTAVYKMFIQLADYVGVPKKKAHPHSFRHLFAVTYMQKYSNLFELADLLGHSSLETTRIYTMTTAEEKRRKINKLEL
ncbi:MAG: tyrosine-type recombinase/integrase [Lachnospiraceae bacterium]|nr:tyrosine-type recombinase/integrase [Lachnospiraceae bacterium]